MTETQRKNNKKDYAKNKERYLAAFKKWKPAHKKQIAITTKNSHLKRKYGITLSDYYKMVKIQKDCCYICNKKPKGKRKYRLNVDHNHTTGKVRKLVCSRCNTAIGVLEDKRFPLWKQYLKEFI